MGRVKALKQSRRQQRSTRRKFSQRVKRNLLGPVVGAALAVAGIASYHLATSHAETVSQAEIMSPAVIEATSTAYQSEDRPAPDFTVTDAYGKQFKLSDYKGKVVVLNFWATWCPPCRREIPDFLELQKQYGDQGLQFIGIALDEEGMAKVKPFVEANKITYPVAMGTKALVSSYGEMNVIPVSILIDRQGVIRMRWNGMRQKAVVESLITPLLNERQQTSPASAGGK